MTAKWCVWGPELYGGRVVVDSELTKAEAIAGASRRNASAIKFGAKGGYQAAKEGDPAPLPEVDPSGIPEVRKDPELAYKAFMAMGLDEWKGLLQSLLHGGILQPGEQVGFERALKERGLT